MPVNALQTALYCRLSKDDERHGESMSIENQKAILIKYAKDNDLEPFKVYVDDGYSGLNFDRPGFQEMLDDIALGKIGTVVTKDLSRLGRDHLQVGQYTEIYFPSHGIRYIAIYDGVDTNDSHSSDFAAIKNVINEFHSRDTSRKIKATVKVRAQQGKYRTTVAPYGYVKDPEDNNHLIIDPETAPIVEKIYDLVLKGWGNYRIRDYLRETKAPMPSWRMTERGWIDRSYMFPTEESKYMWRPDTLRNLIRNRVYCGDTVNCKTEMIFKTGKHPKTPEDKWIIVENTHEPIVSREVWERANNMIAVKRREYNEKMKGYKPTLFRGLLKCYDCHYALSRRSYGHTTDLIIYACGRYCTYGKERCSQHKLYEEDLIETVLADINEKAKLAVQDRGKLIDMIMAKDKKTSRDDHSKHQQAITQARKRLSEVEKVLDRLYEDHVLGTLSVENYRRMMAKYQDEQESLRKEIYRLGLQCKDEEMIQTEAEKFAELVAMFDGVTELNSDMLNTLIDRIEVHEVEIIDGVAHQQLDIYYRFAGLIDPQKYESSTYYKFGEVREASRKRSERHLQIRKDDVQKEVNGEKPEVDNHIR